MVAYNVVYHSVRGGVEASLKEVHRVLRSSGSLLVTFLSKRDGYRVERAGGAGRTAAVGRRGRPNAPGPSQAQGDGAGAMAPISGSGHWIDESTIVKEGGAEDGIAHYFAAHDEVNRPMKDFDLLRTAHKDEWFPELARERRSSHWAVWARRR